MKRRLLSIDINCDLGEGMDHDEDIMPYISSANIACGMHAGDHEIMKRTIDYCLLHHVKIGAHPSFDDRQNFGRTEISLPMDQLYDLVIRQVLLLDVSTKSAGGKLIHVKPHGALYAMAARDPVMAATFVNAIKDFDARLILFGPSGSHLILEGEKAGLTVYNEGFADRTYQDDGSLTPRSKSNALIVNTAQCVRQVQQLIHRGTVITISGKEISLDVDTICIHGDSANALEFAKEIHGALTSEGIQIEKDTSV